MIIELKYFPYRRIAWVLASKCKRFNQNTLSGVKGDWKFAIIGSHHDVMSFQNDNDSIIIMFWVTNSNFSERAKGN